MRTMLQATTLVTLLVTLSAFGDHKDPASSTATGRLKYYKSGKNCMFPGGTWLKSLQTKCSKTNPCGVAGTCWKPLLKFDKAQNVCLFFVPCANNKITGTRYYKNFCIFPPNRARQLFNQINGKLELHWGSTKTKCYNIGENSLDLLNIYDDVGI